MYVSGQVGINPVTNQLVQGGIECEFKQIIENICNILKIANGDIKWAKRQGFDLCKFFYFFLY